MADQTLRGLQRLIGITTRGDRASMDSLIDLGEVSGVSGNAGEVPTCTVDGDDAQVFEPYGLASSAPGGDALTFAPAGDTDDLVALVSSVSGRPATDTGDVAVWSAAGHTVYLDDNGALTITSKDGAVIELPASGGVTITAATGANITINVDSPQSVNVGGVGALPMLLAQATENYLVAAANAVTGTPDVVAGFVAFAGLLTGLANAAATQKAKGE
jgi:phage gp45-like